MKQIVIVDIDGTLANVDHRLRFVQQEKKDWKTFFDQMVNDEVNEWCKTFIKLHRGMGFDVYLFTGRPETHREQTEWWLKKHDIKYDSLEMRRKGDFRPDTVVKSEMLHEVFDTPEARERILYIVDDRQSVVDMWREQGLTCLQCNQWEEWNS